jgi:hypothetical protein
MPASWADIRAHLTWYQWKFVLRQPVRVSITNHITLKCTNRKSGNCHSFLGKPYGYLEFINNNIPPRPPNRLSRGPASDFEIPWLSYELWLGFSWRTIYALTIWDIRANFMIRDLRPMNQCIPLRKSIPGPWILETFERERHHAAKTENVPNLHDQPHENYAAIHFPGSLAALKVSRSCRVTLVFKSRSFGWPARYADATTFVCLYGVRRKANWRSMFRTLSNHRKNYDYYPDMNLMAILEPLVHRLYQFHKSTSSA